MSSIDPQEFGRLQERVDVLVDAIKELTGKVEKMDQQLSEAKGGWKLLMALGTASATAGGALSWVLTHLPWKGPT